MNEEWIFIEIARWLLTLVFAYIGYRLGLRSQKIQVLREYITGKVEDIYPSLFSEMKRNSEILDNFLEKPNVSFHFPELDDVYNSGLEEIMKRHHKDLFLMVDSFKKEILPEFNELDTLVMELMEKMFDVWSKHLGESLPKEVVHTSNSIAVDLIKSINPYYVLPDLLNRRDKEVRNKIEARILDRTSHIYREKAKRPFVIRGQSESINFDEISQSLIEKAKPEIANLIEKYKELKKQNDIEVKEKLLPLLKKYISKPI